MTYIVGWKYRGNLYLISDTAITRYEERGNSVNSTSFGETQTISNNSQVNEECFKIIQIDTSCIIAITGDVKNAIEFIDNVKKYSSPSSRLDFFKKFSSSIIDKDFDVIIGLIVDNKAKLISLESNSRKNLKKINNSIICLGSGKYNLETKTNELIQEIKGAAKNPSEKLHLLVSGHQLLSINENYFTAGVGGIYNGVRMSKHGVYWNKDVSYVLYSKNTNINPGNATISGNSYIIFAFNRGGMLYVKSPYPLPHETDKLIPSCKYCDLEDFEEHQREWNITYYRKLNNVVYSRNVITKYISFIYKYFGGNYTVLSVKMTEKNKKNYQIINNGNGWYYLKFPKDLLDDFIFNDGNKSISCKILK